MTTGTVPVLLWQNQFPGVGIAGATTQIVALLNAVGIVWDRLNHQAYFLYTQDGPICAYGIASGTWFGIVGTGCGAAGSRGSVPDPYKFTLYSGNSLPA